MKYSSIFCEKIESFIFTRRDKTTRINVKRKKIWTFSHLVHILVVVWHSSPSSLPFKTLCSSSSAKICMECATWKHFIVILWEFSCFFLALAFLFIFFNINYLLCTWRGMKACLAIKSKLKTWFKKISKEKINLYFSSSANEKFSLLTKKVEALTL